MNILRTKQENSGSRRDLPTVATYLPRCARPALSRKGHITASSCKLVIRAVAHNAPLSFMIKGIRSITQLRQLIYALSNTPDKKVYKAIFLMGFYGFYCLSTLVPSARSGFSPSRFITHGDVIWGPPGAHIITKCSKNNQVSGQSRIVQLPALTVKYAQ